MVQVKAIEQYVQVVLTLGEGGARERGRGGGLHAVQGGFKSVDETLVCDHSNESH